MPTHRRLMPVWSLPVPIVLAVLLAAAGRGRAPAAAAPADWPMPPYAATWLPRATLPPYWVYRLYADPIGRRLYARISAPDNSALAVYNTDTGALVGRLPYDIDGFYLTPGGERLYLVTASPGSRAIIHRLDPQTLQETGTATYPCPPEREYCIITSVAEGPGGRFYVARYGEAVLDVLDWETGVILHSVTLNSSPHGTLSVVSRGDTLYVGSTFEAWGSPGIAAYDVSDVVPVPIAFYPLDDEPRLALSPDGAYLGADTGGGFAQFRAEPLQFLWQQPAMFAGYFAGGSPLVQAWQSGYHVRFLVALDPLTGAPVRGLTERRHPEYGDWGEFAPLADGGVAILYNEGLELRRPADYAAVLPVLMNRACPGGPIIDRFRDPASGWPIRLIGPVTYDYTGDGYRIFMSNPGEWTAVTRADVWDNATLLLAATNVPPGPSTQKYASVGLLYGLNDDWTDFYTYEVDIDRTTWYHFHYHDGEWEQLQTGRLNHWVYNGREVLQLRRDPYTGQVLLGVATQHEINISEAPGRVGFVAGSFARNVDVRMYHYEFHGENCDVDSRAAPLEVAPAHIARSHPTLE